MYQPQSDQMSVFENEHLFQLQGLNPDNDWVRLAKLIPWAELERRYAQTFDSNLGNMGKRSYGLNLIMERLQDTSEVAIHPSILTMNLWRCLRKLLFALIQRVLRGIGVGDERLVRNLFVALFTETNSEMAIVQ